MSEEEKEAINKLLLEIIKNYEEFYKDINVKELNFISEDYKNAKILLNYIDKLQKENEVLEKMLEKAVEENIELGDEVEDLYSENQAFKCFYVSKYQIMTKIKEIDKEYNDYIYNVPKEQQEEADIKTYKSIKRILLDLLKGE